MMGEAIPRLVPGALGPQGIHKIGYTRVCRIVMLPVLHVYKVGPPSYKVGLCWCMLVYNLFDCIFTIPGALVVNQTCDDMCASCSAI